MERRSYVYISGTDDKYTTAWLLFDALPLALYISLSLWVCVVQFHKWIASKIVNPFYFTQTQIIKFCIWSIHFQLSTESVYKDDDVAQANFDHHVCRSSENKKKEMDNKSEIRM